MNKVINSIDYFSDPSTGRPASSGYVYIGEPDTDPTIEANQKIVSALQENGSFVSLSQPISLSPGGNPTYNGSVISLYVDGDYSITVKNFVGSQLQYVPSNYASIAGEIFIFDTVADMKAAAPIVGNIYSTKGYYSAGDGGESTYLIKTAAQYGGTPDEYGDHTVNTDDVAVLQHSGEVSPKQFGAVGNNITDDTLPLQAAIDSGILSIKSNKSLSYKITDELSITSAIVIDFGHGELTMDDDTGLLSHIVVGDGITQVNEVKIKNITFVRSQAATGGSAVYFNYAGVSLVKGCRIYGDSKIYIGITVYRGIVVSLVENLIQGCVLNGIYLQGTGTGGDRTVDTVITECRIELCATAIAAWDFVEGLFVRNNIFYNMSSDIVTVSSSIEANGLLSFKFQDNDFDGADNGVGLYMNNVSNIQVNDNWFASDGAYNIQIEDTVDSILIEDNQIYNTVNDGIYFKGTNGSILGNIFGVTGINVELATTVENVIIDENNFSSGGTYGVYFDGVCDSVTVSNNIFGTFTDPIANIGSITNCIFTNNLGDVKVGTGEYITIGSSPFTYTSGPRHETISILGGTVSNVACGGVNIAFSTDKIFTLPPNTSVTVTYSSLSFMPKIYL